MMGLMGWARAQREQQSASRSSLQASSDCSSLQQEVSQLDQEMLEHGECMDWAKMLLLALQTALTEQLPSPPHNLLVPWLQVT